MSAEEKFNQEVWAVLNKIKKRYFYSKSNGDIDYRIYHPPVPDENMPLGTDELKIINKLQEWKAAKIKAPKERMTDAEVSVGRAMNKTQIIIYLEILQPKFNEIYSKYQKLSRVKGKYWIDYTKDRFVVLNGEYVICKTQFNSKSDSWFGYIFNNPKKRISLEEIKQKSGEKMGSTFNKLLDHLKFRGQLRKLFFEQSKQFIIFDNPVNEEDFERKLIDHKKLNLEIKRLEKVGSVKSG